MAKRKANPIKEDSKIKRRVVTSPTLSLIESLLVAHKENITDKASLKLIDDLVSQIEKSVNNEDYMSIERDFDKKRGTIIAESVAKKLAIESSDLSDDEKAEESAKIEAARDAKIQELSAEAENRRAAVLVSYINKDNQRNEILLSVINPIIDKEKNKRLCSGTKCATTANDLLDPEKLIYTANACAKRVYELQQEVEVLKAKNAELGKRAGEWESLYNKEKGKIGGTTVVANSLLLSVLDEKYAAVANWFNGEGTKNQGAQSKARKWGIGITAGVLGAFFLFGGATGVVAAFDHFANHHYDADKDTTANLYNDANELIKSLGLVNEDGTPMFNVTDEASYNEFVNYLVKAKNTLEATEKLAETLGYTKTIETANDYVQFLGWVGENFDKSDTNGLLNDIKTALGNIDSANGESVKSLLESINDKLQDYDEQAKLTEKIDSAVKQIRAQIEGIEDGADLSTAVSKMLGELSSLRGSNAVLNTQVEELNAKLEALGDAKTVAELAARIQELETSVGNLEIANGALKEDNDKLNQENAAYVGYFKALFDGIGVDYSDCLNEDGTLSLENFDTKVQETIDHIVKNDQAVAEFNECLTNLFNTLGIEPEGEYVNDKVNNAIEQIETKRAAIYMAYENAFETAKIEKEGSTEENPQYLSLADFDYDLAAAMDALSSHFDSSYASILEALKTKDAELAEKEGLLIEAQQKAKDLEERNKVLEDQINSLLGNNTEQGGSFLPDSGNGNNSPVTGETENEGSNTGAGAGNNNNNQGGSSIGNDEDTVRGK